MTGEITGYKYTPIKNFLGKFEEANIQFKDSNSNICEFTTHVSSKKITIFNLIDKYSTNASPNITAKEVIDFRTDFAQSITPLAGGGGLDDIDYYAGIDFLLNTYCSENSDGGKDITPQEIARMFEAIRKWDC